MNIHDHLFFYLYISTLQALFHCNAIERHSTYILHSYMLRKYRQHLSSGVNVGNQGRNYIIAHRIGTSEILPWVRKSCLTMLSYRGCHVRAYTLVVLDFTHIVVK